MNSRIEEIEPLSPYLTEKAKETREITYAREQSLAKGWMLPEEDAAWAGL